VTAEQFAAEPVPAGGPVQPERTIPEVHVEDPELEKWREDFTGLLHLGALPGWFDWCGHRIDIRTLNTDGELIVGHLMKEFEGGMAGAKAYATATVALAVTAIDGRPMPVPLGEDPGRPFAWALDRLQTARQWYPPTIDAMFDAYLALEAKQREILAGLGKASALAGGAIPGWNGRSGSPSEEDS
jgi:hypothetical protein